MTTSMGTFFRMTDIVKKYPMGEEFAVVLKGISLQISEGEYVSVLGPSGSGKSDLALRLIRSHFVNSSSSLTN